MSRSSSRRTSPLVHPVQWQLAQCLYYYRVLNKDPDWTAAQGRPRFPEALAEALERFGEQWAAAKELEGHLDYGRLRNPQDFAWITDEAITRLREELPERAAYLEAGRSGLRILQDFAREWLLPADHGVEALRFSFWLSLYSKKPRLQTGLWRYAVRPVGSVSTVTLAEDDGTVIFREPEPVIFPNCPIPFLYDPTERNASRRLRDHVTRVLEDIGESVSVQAAALEDQAKAQGWRQPGPRHRGESARRELEKGARRLYRVAICRMDIDEIADQEWSERDPHGHDSPPHPDAIRKMIRDWADSLDIRIRQ